MVYKSSVDTENVSANVHILGGGEVSASLSGTVFRHRGVASSSDAQHLASQTNIDEEEPLKSTTRNSFLVASGSKKTDETQNDKDEEHEQEEKLANTTFSLLFIADVNSNASLYAACVILVQITIVLAAMLDSLDLESTSNPGKFPPGVEIAVTVAQAVVIPLAVASQKDLIEAMVRMNDRLSENVKIDLHSKTFFKWLLSSISQFTVGTGILVCAFLFTMQADTVFRVLVNFVALFLVSNISGVAFDIASRGFLGEKVWQTAIKVTNHVVKRKYRSTWFIQLMFLFCMSAMYAGFAIVKHRQLSGYYLCNSVYLQFDDSFNLTLPYLSGTYGIDPRSDKVFGRYTYSDSVSQSRFRIAYCHVSDAFGISTHSSWRDNATAGDVCNMAAVSQVTGSFNLMDTSKQVWKVYSDRDDTLVDTKTTVMQCVDCSLSSCLPHRGTCVDNKCVCKDGRYGIRCQFRAPCERIVNDANRVGFPPIPSILNEDYVSLDTNYTVLRDDNGTLALAYFRPIYYSEGFRNVILFAGRRWVIISPLLAIEQDPNFPALEKDQIKVFLLSLFQDTHLYDVLTDPFLQKFAVSEPIDSGSYIDQGTPVGLLWRGMRVVRRGNDPVFAINRDETFSVNFMCEFCETGRNDCLNFGDCNDETGVCECAKGTIGFPLYTGALCEKAVGCVDAKKDPTGLLPTGCVGSYTCQEETGDCDCLEDYPDAGRFCQFLPCFEATMREIYPPHGCANGRCGNVTGSCICDPPLLWEGKYCQNRQLGCNETASQLLYPPNGCDNDGICNNDTGVCTCTGDLFEGRYCESVVPSCTSDQFQNIFPGGCDNGGACNNETGSCECSSPIFEGRYCQREIGNCTSGTVVAEYPPTGCDNGGVCNITIGTCLCEEGFTGRFCQKVVSSNQTDSEPETTNV